MSSPPSGEELVSIKLDREVLAHFQDERAVIVARLGRHVVIAGVAVEHEDRVGGDVGRLLGWTGRENPHDRIIEAVHERFAGPVDESGSLDHVAGRDRLPARRLHPHADRAGLEIDDAARHCVGRRATDADHVAAQWFWAKPCQPLERNEFGLERRRPPRFDD